MTRVTAKIFLLVGLFSAWMAFGQTNVVESELDTDPSATGYGSPRETMFTFIHAMNALAVNPEMGPVADGAIDYPPDLTTHTARENRALQLMGIFNRLGEVKETHLPDAVEMAEREISYFVFYPNSEIHPSKLNQYGRDQNAAIVLRKMVDGTWRFDQRTIANLPRLHESMKHEPNRFGKTEVELNPSLVVRRLIPQSWQETKFAGVAVHEWLGVLLIVLVAFMVELMVRLFLRTTTLRWVRKHGGAVEKDTLDKTLKPFGIFIASAVALLMLPLLGMHREESLLAYKILRGAILFLLVLGASWSLWRLVDLVTEFLESKAAKTETKVDDVLVPLVRKSVKVFIAIFGTIYAAESINLPVKPLLTSLGIGGLAFAFAAKDTIENFFGSVAVILDGPFQVGDWVVIGNVEGTVEEIGFRSNRIRTFYNSLVTVPNSSLVRAEVDNYGKRRFRRYKAHVGIEYGTPPEKIVAFTEGIRELVRQHPYTRKDYFQVYLNQFGPSSLDILLYIFHETPDWSTELRERERLMLDIIRLADTLGVGFAFPTQTIHLVNDERGTPPPAAEAPQAETDSRAAMDGRQAASMVIRNQPWRDEKPAAVDFGWKGGGDE